MSKDPTDPEESPAKQESGAPSSGTAHASSHDMPQGNGGMSNLAQRVITAVPALLILLALLAWAPQWLLALLALVVTAQGLREYVGMQEEGDAQTPPALIYTVGLLPALGALLGGAALATLGLSAGLAWMLLWAWFQPERVTDPAPHVAKAATALALIGWPLAHLGLLIALPQGRGFFVLLLLVLVCNDTLAYFVGRIFGITPLAPAISPNKTVEGSMAGLAGGALVGMLGAAWLPDDSPWGLFSMIGLGIVLAAAGQAGDLLESRLKRLHGVKDSSNLIPGHGGLLDRLDAFLLSAPLLYYLCLLVGN